MNLDAMLYAALTLPIALQGSASPAVPIISAILGGSLGATLSAMLTYRLTKRSNRPKPLILIDYLKIDRNARPPGELTTLNRNLIVDINECPYVSKKLPISGKIEEERYVGFLEHVSEEIAEAVNYMLPSIRDAARGLGGYTSSERWNRFQLVWAQQHDTLWPLLKLAVLRGEFSYSNDGLKYHTEDGDHAAIGGDDGAEQVPLEEFGVSKDEENCRYLVELEVARSLFFSWQSARTTENPTITAPTPDYADSPPVARYVERLSVSSVKANTLERFSEDTAKAIARHSKSDKDYLRRLTNFLREAADGYREELKVLHDRVQDELQRYDRLVVRGQISNTGGSPFSVLNEGKLFVQTEGYPYTQESEDNKKKQAYFKKNMEIAVILANEKGQYDAPVSIPQGQVYRFAAVSEENVRALPHHQVLLNVFSAGDKYCYLGSSVTLPGRKGSEQYEYTEPRYFKDWRTDVVIPPQDGFSWPHPTAHTAR